MKPRFSVKKLVLLAMLAAVSYIIVALIRIPVVLFLNYEPKDVIVTIGGFTGRILSVKDDEVTFETGAAKTRLTVKKWAIQTREGADVAEEETKETEESK